VTIGKQELGNREIMDISIPKSDVEDVLRPDKIGV